MRGQRNKYTQVMDLIMLEAGNNAVFRQWLYPRFPRSMTQRTDIFKVVDRLVHGGGSNVPEEIIRALVERVSHKRKEE